MKWSTSTRAAAVKPKITRSFCSSGGSRSWNLTTRIRADRAPIIAWVRLSQRPLKSSYCFTMSTILSPSRHVAPRITGSASCLTLNNEAVMRNIFNLLIEMKWRAKWGWLYSQYCFVYCYVVTVLLLSCQILILLIAFQCDGAADKIFKAIGHRLTMLIDRPNHKLHVKYWVLEIQRISQTKYILIAHCNITRNFFLIFNYAYFFYDCKP